MPFYQQEVIDSRFLYECFLDNEKIDKLEDAGLVDQIVVIAGKKDQILFP